MDPHARKIAILRDPANNNVTFLPKGRKNIGEDLLSAALRETLEETGVAVKPLPLLIPTRATPPAQDESGGGQQEKTENPGLIKGVENCEPSSVTVRPRDSSGIARLIFWFAAAGDSTAALVEGTKESWEEGWVTEWVNANDAASLMTFDDHREVIEKILKDMRSSGYDM